MPRVADLTPEHHAKVKEADRKRHQAKRDAEKLEREKAEAQDFSSAREAYLKSPEAKLVNQYVEETQNTILAELGLPYSAVIDEAMDYMLTVSYSLEHNIIRQTDKGEILGCYYPDVLGDLVYFRHKFDMTRSPIFSGIYWKLLQELDRRFGNNVQSRLRDERESAETIKQELTGTYVYPPPAPVKVEPKPEPPAPPEPDTDLQLQKVLARQRQQLLEDLSRYGQINQFIGPDAMKYLDGGFR